MSQLSVVKEVRGLGQGNHSYLRLEYRDAPNRSWFVTSSLMDVQTALWKQFVDQDSFPVNRILNSRLFVGKQYHSPIGSNGLTFSGGLLVGLEKQSVYARNAVGSNLAFTTRRSRNTAAMVGLPLAIRKQINHQWWLELRGNLLARISTEEIIRSTERNPFHGPFATSFSISTGLELNPSSFSEPVSLSPSGWRVGWNISDLAFTGIGLSVQFPISKKLELALDGSARFGHSDVVLLFSNGNDMETRTEAMHRVGATLKYPVHEQNHIHSYLMGRFHFTHGKIQVSNQFFGPSIFPNNGFRFNKTITENYGVSSGFGVEFSKDQWWMDIQLFSGYQIPNKYQGFVVLDPRLRQGSFTEFRLIVGADLKK